MKYTIPVVTRLQDNGDGGWTQYVYNNEEEMLADHPLTYQWDTKQRKEIRVELTEKQKRNILTEDDPHENGYIGRDQIEVEVDENGQARLASPLSFHSGQ